ncbi:hypothetical protein ACH9L7_15585 [Haloferax sp. S1W]|uniref:hypothetical protein n=1 Tax=Haloferax sp. S1W TaxID=3377110 RepID=UPI0037C8C469
MVPHHATRREVLSLSGAALASLAGCTTRTSNREQSPSPTASEPDYPHRVDTPDTVTVRNPDGEPAADSSDHSPEEDMFESSPHWAYEDWLVTAPGEREALNFSQAHTGVEAARDFIAATDLSETTLLVHQYNIGPCETRQLSRLEWGTEFSCGDIECTGIALGYDLTERDGDCNETGSDGPPYRAGSYASEATFVRIPAQLESYGRFRVQV